MAARTEAPGAVRAGGIGDAAYAVVGSAALVVFAVFAHRSAPVFWVSIVGLSLASAVIALSLTRAENPRARLGFLWSRRLPPGCAAGLALGIALGASHRLSLALPLFPRGGWEPFAALAALIGVCEELVYRGWVQGCLVGIGRVWAIVGAAGAHAAYKTALFVWPQEPFAGDILSLGVLTWLGGLFFGLLRDRSGSVMPAMVAHAVFDVVAYGAVARAPWWVWG